MKKLKQVNWIKCENDFELVEKMLSTIKVLRCRDNFFFNHQQHEIADIKRTLKNHNDWHHKINCYYNATGYYMVCFKEDKIDVVYCDKTDFYNNKYVGILFFEKLDRCDYMHKTWDEVKPPKLSDIVF